MKFKLVAIKSIAEQKNYKLNIRLFEIKYWCASVYSVCVCMCLCTLGKKRGDRGNWRGHEECITLTPPSGGHQEHPCMNSALQHVLNMWASHYICVCLCVRERVHDDLCARLCLCLGVCRAVWLQSCMIWHILSLETLYRFSSDHHSICLCTWKLMRRTICYTGVYVECVWLHVCKIISY